MTFFRSSAPGLLAVLLLTGCGGGDAPVPEADAGPDAAASDAAAPGALPGRMGAIDAANRAAAAASSRSAPAASPDAMRERMPARAAGLPRSDLRVETGGAGTPGVTTVRATYGSGPRRVQISMADLGAVPGLAASLVPWLGSEFDRQAGGGFERTVRIEGLQGFEAGRTEGGADRSEVAVMAGSVLVRLEGWGVGVRELREALEQLDPGALAR
jgi:hypothetical protein